LDNFAGFTNIRFMRIALVAVGMLAQTFAYAQLSLETCARIEDDTERLACYDEVARPTAGSFGLQDINVPKPTSENQIENIVANVTKATHTPYTGWIVTLDNGQTWKQIGTDSFAIREGDSCTIERAVLDSFRLKCGNRARQIRVAREE
jgi:hypothetical protein